MLKRREIIKTEFKKLLTKEVLSYFIIVPILAVLAFGYMYSKRIGREYPIVVVDEEKSSVSRLAIFYLDSSPELRVTKTLDTLEDGYTEMRNENALAIVYLQRGLYKNVIRKSSQPAIVIMDGRNLVSANSVLTGIAKTLGAAKVGAELKLMDKYFPVPDRLEKILPLKIISRSMGNPSMDYFLFVISAIFILAIQQGVLVGSCLGISKENEFGTLDQTIKSCGGSIRYFFYRHVAVMGFAFPMVLITSFIFHVVFSTPSENIVLSILMLLLFSASVITFSNFLGSFFKRRVMVLQVLFFYTLPAFFISGYTFPLENIHPVIRTIAALLPTTPILNSFPRIDYIEGAAPYMTGFILHQAALYLLYMLLSFYCLRRQGAFLKNRPLDPRKTFARP